MSVNIVGSTFISEYYYLLAFVTLNIWYSDHKYSEDQKPLCLYYDFPSLFCFCESEHLTCCCVKC